MKPQVVNQLMFLLAFLGIGAIGGGAILMVSPSGKLMDIPLSILKYSPFHNFLTPRIILFTVLGVAPCLLIYLLLKKPDSKFFDRMNVFYDMHWSWSFCIYVAFALIIWIQAEMMYLQSVSWLHTFYILYAILILIVALLPKVRNFYKIKTIEK
jgi:hypothetical protein